MMFKRSSTTPVKPMINLEDPLLHYQPYQPSLRSGPLSSPVILPFDIGTTIDNPKDGTSFEFIRPLGNGSYAVVYMVREKSTNKYYALKCLSKLNLSSYHLDVQRNEVHIHKKLEHPNIVKLDHYFETPDWLFLVLEYCEGQDLYYWLTQNNDSRDPKTGKQLSEMERLKIVQQVFIQILNAVDYCHSQVKLTDFGLATDEKKSEDFDCGSKPYMSYECRNPIHKTYNTYLADIWSIGIIFLNLIYHRSPWSDPNPKQCKSFAAFEEDKPGFLMHRFASMPGKVAYFLAEHVFCNAEEGRVTVKEWINWCNNLVEKMLPEEGNVERSSPDLSSLISRQISPICKQDKQDEHDSWSEVFGEFDNEMDFTAPVLFIDKHPNDDSLNISNSTKLEKDIKIREKSDESKVANKEKDEKDDEVIANNSDADSGFGTDEDINSITKKVSDLKNVDNSNSAKISLSVSPPRVIYCKPKPWVERKTRGHQREPSLENNLTSNNHWDSYNQRRERLERRKQELHSSPWSSNRRRGSISTENETLVPQRQIRPRPSYYNDTKKEKSTYDPKHSPGVLPKPSVELNTINSSRPRVFSKSFEKTPKKIAKSTKTHLSKMLAGVVMFNRGVKVGGQGTNDM
ncbi:11935_t:CDS:2 [Diversispora eburnea]|uniref:11935_t:CDS:1 n=1 Tax=Diversispora eburnea TaxID=1213867 RepID=A0A9N8V281_9GLOM|nr:11935_t:CDS:2 [Diversispora eburnea]